VQPSFIPTFGSTIGRPASDPNSTGVNGSGVTIGSKEVASPEAWHRDPRLVLEFLVYLLFFKSNVNIVNELFGSHAPVSPLRIKVCCRMLGQYLAFGSTRFDHTFDTVANSHYHVAKRLNRCASCHFSSCRYYVETAIRPAVEGFYQIRRTVESGAIQFPGAGSPAPFTARFLAAFR
jgi:hypothetical protein